MAQPRLGPVDLGTCSHIDKTTCLLPRRWAPVSVRALRGATTVARNDAGEIGQASVELVRGMLEVNGLEPSDVISMIFTMTDDLDAAFPAEAVRTAGLGEGALLCAREIPVPGSLPRCIRVLMHLEAAPGAGLRDLYLRDAAGLRDDLLE